MPNVLKVTTPGAGFDNNSIKNNPNPGKSDIQIQNPVDPARVGRGDNRTDSGQDKQDGNLQFHYESNFNTFVQMLKSSPRLLDQLGDILFQELGQAGGAAEVGSVYRQALAELLQMIEVEPGQMAEYLKDQVSSASKFKSGLFTLLRSALDETASVTVKTDILNFLKHYNDMSSGPHLLERIRTTAQFIRGQMFLKGRDELDKSLEDMNWGARPGDTGHNAQVLKDQVLPTLGSYISATRDMGKIRDDISLLSVLISHYENGSLEETVQSFDKMMSYPDVRRFLEGLDEEKLTEALRNMDFEAEAGKTEWNSRFQSLLREGAKGGAGLEYRAAFLDMVHSMVMNESVYMPLVHLMFPMNVDGRQMVSEMWIDPDHDGGNAKGDGRQAPAQKLFIKFDIRDLGMFDLIIICREEEMNVQLRYPEHLRSFEGDIQSSVSQIAQRNGYRVNQVVLETGREPLDVLQVFPEIYERKNSINVRV